MTVLETGQAVGVFDDDEGQARALGFQLEDVGMDPVVADLGDVSTVESAVEWIRVHKLGGLICDVQLGNLRTGMRYQGAELVSQLVREDQLPCVLTTGFSPDLGMLVRPYRADIPVLLGRDETEQPDALMDGLTRCAAEILGGRPPERRTFRAPLFIERVGPTEHGLAADARIGGRPHKTPMRFPAKLLGRDADADLLGKVFFAHVNLAAEREDDLFLESVEAELIDASTLDLHFGT